RIITEADKRGMNDDEVIASLSQRGMPAGEQQKLRSRITAVRQQKLGNTRATDLAPPSEDSGRTVNDDAVLYDTLENRIAQDRPDSSRIFGSNLFRNSNTRFEP